MNQPAPLLSILIPSLYSRQAFLCKMIEMVYSQPKEFLQHVEVLVSVDDGKKTTGRKRNELAASATGVYCVYVDDDDKISTAYLAEIFAGIALGVDHIGITGIYKPDNGQTKMFKCGKDYIYGERNNIYYRNAQHLCPIKTDIVRQITYPDISFGEDKDWSDRLKLSGLIQTEYLIENPIYIYEYISNKKK